VCDLDVMDTPSKLRVIRKDVTLVRSRPRKPRDASGTCHGRFSQVELLKLQKSGQFPDEPVSAGLQKAKAKKKSSNTPPHNSFFKKERR
jgi:hypothetical protein